MKRPLIVAAAAFAVSIAMPAVAHHAASGIVSDEIYDAIEANLLEADSPHLLQTSDDLMGGQTIIVTIPVEDVDLVLDGISEGLTGSGAMEASSVDVSISPMDDEGNVTVTIIENFGQGESQLSQML